MTSSIDALQVDEAFLQATQASSANYALFEYIKAIQSSFGIDWPSVKWEDLRMPLYSGLGARLYLEWSVCDVTHAPLLTHTHLPLRACTCSDRH